MPRCVRGGRAAPPLLLSSAPGSKESVTVFWLMGEKRKDRGARLLAVGTAKEDGTRPGPPGSTPICKSPGVFGIGCGHTGTDGCGKAGLCRRTSRCFQRPHHRSLTPAPHGDPRSPTVAPSVPDTRNQASSLQCGASACSSCSVPDTSTGQRAGPPVTGPPVTRVSFPQEAAASRVCADNGAPRPLMPGVNVLRHTRGPPFLPWCTA